MYQYVLFDLDGTLTDPKEGITKSVQFALRSFGIEEKNLDKLEPFIGPPLSDSFRDFYGFDETKVKQAITSYREYFEKTGIFQNKIFEGMERMLENLQKRGIFLAIASSKPEASVHVVLKHFGIEKYFDLIVGSLKDGTRETKIDVMKEVFRQLNECEKKRGKTVDLAQVLMVGDRKFDVEGARYFGVDSVAVTYGYANEGELEEAEPTWMAGSVRELEEVILQTPSYMKYQDKTSIFKTLQILYPLAVYWIWELLIFNSLYYLIGRCWQVTDSLKPQISVYLNAVAAVSTWPMTYFLYKRSREKDASLVVTRRNRKRVIQGTGFIVAYAIALALGLNLLVIHLRLTNLSTSFSQVASTQYSVSIGIGLFVYGILTPITEELIFRGVIYNRIRKFFPTPIAIFLGALVFGCYHGNLVQICYAFFMGLAVNFVYEYFQNLAAPILFHCSANLIVYLLSKTIGEVLARGSILYAIVFLTFACGVTVFFIRDYKRSKRKYFR